jgi:putative ATP-grasp target RiPP
VFAHSDRLPTGSPLPNGVATPRPWGVRRMAPYPGNGSAAYARAELDPQTQRTVYRDSSGAVMKAPGHGTSTGTNPPTGTGNPGDGSGPGGPGGGGDQDTGNDNDQ